MPKPKLVTKKKRGGKPTSSSTASSIGSKDQKEPLKTSSVTSILPASGKNANVDTQIQTSKASSQQSLPSKYSRNTPSPTHSNDSHLNKNKALVSAEGGGSSNQSKKAPWSTHELNKL